jgi:hypothetical protein
LTGIQGQYKETGCNFSFCFSLSNLKGLFSNLLFNFELTSHSDLTWTQTFGGSCVGLYRGMATGFDRWRRNIFKQEEASLYFWIFCGLELLGAAWESGTHIFSIDQLNQRKTTFSKDQAIYQRMEEAPLGRIWKYWPEIDVMTQTPEATVRYEWMECLMPRNLTVDRPYMVHVICTVEDYTTIKQKVWESSSLRGDTTQLLGWFTRRIVDLPLEDPEWQPYLFAGVHQPLAPIPFSLVAAEHLPPRSASFALMDYKGIQKGRNPLLPNYVGHIGRKTMYEADGPLESMDDILICTEKGVMDFTTEEWEKLKGYPSSWGTTAKDRWWIIQEPSLHFLVCLGGRICSHLYPPIKSKIGTQ